MNTKPFTLRSLLLAVGAVLILALDFHLMAEEAEPPKTHVIPPGAAACGFNQKLFDVAPTLEDISPDRQGDYPWYSGEWCHPVPPMEKYSMTDGVLTIESGGELVSYPPDFSHPGKLPTLSGEKGFYIEFEVSTSDNDMDHWPAVWLLPIEKNRKQTDDVYDGAPAKFEHWMELDVEEGGFGPGTLSTVHNIWGIWPDNFSINNGQAGRHGSDEPLDRTQKHRFGASYDPRTSTICWWLDEKLMVTTSAPYVPEIAKRQHYYMLMSALMHKEKKPYKMYIHAVRAYEPAGE